MPVLRGRPHHRGATCWLGDFDPYESTETGRLTWTGPGGRGLRLAEVPPVAWSEGMRMAAATVRRPLDRDPGGRGVTAQQPHPDTAAELLDAGAILPSGKASPATTSTR
ncbi:hypothetical protein ACU686_21065 [Yinghuangia aomiensis]